MSDQKLGCKTEFLGFLQVKSPKAFNQRIYSLIKDAMDIKGDLTVAPIDESVQVHFSLVVYIMAYIAEFAQRSYTARHPPCSFWDNT